MRFTMTKARAIIFGFLGIALVGVIDVIAGFEVSLLVLHIVPLLIVTWFTSLRWGLFFALLLTIISGATAVYFAPPVSNPTYRYVDLGSDFIAILLLVFMQAQLRKSYDQITRDSKADALTGCLNKGGFSEQLQAEIDRQKRYRRSFSLIYFDCDNFKVINDTLGHHIGDVLLAEIGRVLEYQLREVDSVGRLGGDEFAVLLRESDAEAARKTAEHIKHALDAEMRSRSWPVSFSIGIASFDVPPISAAKGLQLADALMYQVKKDGIRVQRY